jgi:phospholipase A1
MGMKPEARQPGGLFVGDERNQVVMMKRIAITRSMLACVLIPALWCHLAWAGGNEPELDPACVMHMAKEAPANTTLAELRRQCQVIATEETPKAIGQEAAMGMVEKRLEAESESVLRPFSLMTHKPNYVLAAAWNSKGWADRPLGQNPPQTTSYEDYEAQFQVSIKVPLGIGLFNDRVDWYAAYTNRSFWQVYDHVDSEPFRETNHEPESWLQMKNDWTVFGFRNSINSLGIVHQSNGQSGNLSRTWNRVYGNFVFERGDWALSFKPWVWVFQEYGEVDNPDIDDYMGHGEFRASYAHGGHVFSGMLRNQFESGFDRGALELSWSFPVFGYPYLKGYVQFFNGYGESLIDYNREVNRIGIGISVTDWLQ